MLLAKWIQDRQIVQSFLGQLRRKKTSSVAKKSHAFQLFLFCIITLLHSQNVWAEEIIAHTVVKPRGVSTAVSSSQNGPPIGALTLLLKSSNNSMLSPSRVLIGSEGGEVVAFGLQGRVFRLIIPPKAILGPPVVITIQPLESVQGLPISGEPLAGVLLEPEGLHFMKPVTLEVRLPQPKAATELLALSGGSGGNNLFFVPLIPTESVMQSVSLQLYHFSPVWVGRGTASDIDKNVTPPVYEDAFMQNLANVIADRAAENIGEVEYQDTARTLLGEYFTEEVLPWFKIPSYECIILDTALERVSFWLNWMQFYGFDSSGGLTTLSDSLPENAKQALNAEVTAMAQSCRNIQETISCEADELIKRVALCDAHAENLSVVTGIDLTIDPELTGNFCPGKPAAIRIEPLRTSLCTYESFSFTAKVVDTGENIIYLPIQWNSTNKQILTLGPGNVAKGMKRGLADLKATTGCSVELYFPIKVGIVDLVGDWYAYGTETVKGCTDAGEYEGGTEINIRWQYEVGTSDGGIVAYFGGTGFGGDFHGQVNCFGTMSAEGIYVQAGEGTCWQGDRPVECDVEGHTDVTGQMLTSIGEFPGQGLGMSMSITTESVDIIGDTCVSKGEGIMSRPASAAY